MNKRNFLSIFTILFVAASIFFLHGDLSSLIGKAEKGGQGVLQSLGRASSAILPLINEEPASTPGPLTVIKKSAPPAEEGAVTISGIISQTNLQRKNNNLPPLSENDELDASALVKVKDMFAEQYFEHTSPDGATVTTLVTARGYEYIVVGENLALGNFASSKDIVDAWMASPGHRANILNTRFTDIGVGVMQGNYKGDTVWMAVQHFGLPRSACPSVDESLKNTITANQAQIDADEAKLEQLKNQMAEEGSNGGSPHASTVDEYNSLVKIYNSLLAETDTEISDYNQEVRALNACIAGS